MTHAELGSGLELSDRRALPGGLTGEDALRPTLPVWARQPPGTCALVRAGLRALPGSESLRWKADRLLTPAPCRHRENKASCLRGRPLASSCSFSVILQHRGLAWGRAGRGKLSKSEVF